MTCQRESCLGLGLLAGASEALAERVVAAVVVVVAVVVAVTLVAVAVAKAVAAAVVVVSAVASPIAATSSTVRFRTRLQLLWVSFEKVTIRLTFVSSFRMSSRHCWGRACKRSARNDSSS